jgi:hypothetical protein
MIDPSLPCCLRQHLALALGSDMHSACPFMALGSWHSATLFTDDKPFFSSSHPHLFSGPRLSFLPLRESIPHTRSL